MLPIELKYFEEVANAGSIREAADRLHIAGSAVSRQISKLEETIGAALFKRTSNGMKLTQAGRVLLDYVHRSRSEIEATKAKIRDVVAMRSGDLIVYAPEGLVDELLIPAIAEFHGKHASVQVIVRSATSDEAIRSLLHNASDIALVLNASQRQDLEVLATIDQGIGLVALASDHQADRWDRPLASVDATHELHAMVLAALALSGEAPRIAFTGNSTAWVRQFVGKGLGVGLLPRTAVERELASGEFVYRPIGQAKPINKIHVCVRRDRSHALAADEFLKILLRRI